MLEANERDRAYDEYRRCAREHEGAGRLDAAWACLEAAHVLGQSETRRHVRAHWDMLTFAWRLHDGRELLGQLLRISAAALATWIWLPAGNTGRANISSLRSMPVPEDLRALLNAGKRSHPGTAPGDTNCSF